MIQDKLKNKLFFLFMVTLSMALTAQEKQLDELESLLEKENPKTELFYNENDQMLDINGYQIPLLFASYRYLDRDGALLKIKGNYAFPIYDPNKDRDVEEIEIRFASKADVYDAINLMNEIKRY